MGGSYNAILNKSFRDSPGVSSLHWTTTPPLQVGVILFGSFCVFYLWSQVESLLLGPPVLPLPIHPLPPQLALPSDLHFPLVVTNC